MIEREFDLTGRVAVVTGASRGLGEAIAGRFAQAGAAVVLASRKQADLDRTAGRIRERGGTVEAVAAHTGDDGAVRRLVAFAADRFGGIDILVNNAATNPHFGPVLAADDGQWAKTLDTNIMGYLRLARAAVPVMQARGGGKIINMASVAGKRPLPGMGVYCISKAAVLMLTEVLAVELAPFNIQVNAIAPGFVRTRFSAALWENPERYQTIVSAVPQHRMAEPDEVTGLALYLASTASSFTTGAAFVVDGGQLVAPGIGSATA